MKIGDWVRVRTHDNLMADANDEVGYIMYVPSDPSNCYAVRLPFHPDSEPGGAWYFFEGELEKLNEGR